MSVRVKLTEIVREFEVKIDGFSQVIKGKVVRVLNPDTEYIYEGYISHYCKTKEDVDVYRPGSLVGKTIDQCSDRLITYLHRFEEYNSIEENSNY